MVTFLFILVIIYIIFSFASFIVIFKRFYDNFIPVKYDLEELIKPYKHLVKAGAEWYSKIKKEDVYVYSDDDLKLHGIVIENKKSKGVMILVHGYRGTIEHDIISSIHEYYKLGMSLLIIEQRACAKSEGSYITFGDLESKDLNKWIELVKVRFKNQKIILAGVSMGATTVLLNDNKDVSGIISDCLYISGYDEINYCTSHYYHYSSKIFLPMINIFCKLIGKFDLTRVDVLKNIGKLEIPILFIHGLDDDFVPTVNTIKAYNYYTHKKELLLVEKANHGVSYLLDRDKYIKTIEKFINNIIK